MTRAIYEKSIYTRLKQTKRKVYDRANNVLPVYVEDYYEVSTVAVKEAGTGYKVDDVLSIPGAEGDTAATVKVTAIDTPETGDPVGNIVTVTLVSAGTYDEDLSGDIAVVGGEGVTGTGAKLTVTMVKIVEDTEE